MRSRTLLVGVAVTMLVVIARTTEGQDASGAPSTKTVWSGVYSAAQADRGAGVYTQHCANCHGAGLEGADMSPALAGAGFMANWNDLTLGDLFERIRISMPADRPGSLTRQQMADVIAHMLRANRFPAGATELPIETPALRTLKFVTVQPTGEGR
ncbi:MAG TPA: cytochrome c [Vicinamibacterales bacterium]|nr:cytochrome c [Vicinamibacterales bacterium]